jgi:CubicO group peptidase (beta-lactamase class C family)
MLGHMLKTLQAMLVAALAMTSVALAAERLPPPMKMMFWSASQQRIGFRNMEKLFATRTVQRGAQVLPLPSEPATLTVDYRFQGARWSTEKFMKANKVAGLLVLQHGKIVLERYALGYTEHDRWTSFSVAKSITSTLVGAAIKDGSIHGLDSQITEYLPSLKGSAYEGVTVQQLLTMTSGVKWNEDYSDPKSDVNRFAFGAPGPDGEDPIVAYMKQLPREAPPGTKWVYKTGESDLMGAVLAHAVHKHIGDYLSEKIWSTYGMEQDAAWMTDQAGEELGGCCMSMTLRDYGRFGLFFLGGGKIDGESILPDDWIAQATRAQVPGYGFQWWILGDGAYAAQGIFGQTIQIDPKDDLVIVTSSAWSQADVPANYEVSYAYFAAVAEALRGR